MKLKEIETKDILINPFSMIEDDWFLITSAINGKVNTMTAASGALGHMFRKNVAYINVRPERYTHEFIEASQILSLSFFDDTTKNKEILGYIGRTTGRDEDKITKSGLTLSYCDEIPFFEEAHTVFLCRCLFRQPYTSNGFLDKNVEDYYYPKRDYHDMYVCEIMKTLVRSNNTNTNSVS